MTIAVGRLERRLDLGRRPASSTPSNRTSRTSGSWWRWTKYSWNSSQPSSVRTSVRTGCVGHRQDRGRDAERPLEVAARRRSAASPRAQPGRPHDVRREVAVAEPEPRLLAVAARASRPRSNVSPSMPQPHSRLSMPGERVHDRVVVGHDEQAVALEVVAGVDDDRQLARRRRPGARAASFAPPTPPARRRRHPARAVSQASTTASRSRPRRIRSIVSRSYGAGSRAMTVPNPSSRYGRIASATTAGEPSRSGRRRCSAPL